MELGQKKLINRLKAGDRDACITLIDSHYQQVYWYLLDLSKDGEKAADLTQNTFAKAWNAIGDFKGESSFRTWLFSIARNEFLLQLRENGKYPESVECLDLEVIADSAPSIEEECTSRDMEHFVREQVKTLPVKYREAISLHYFARMSFRQVAKILSIPNGTVKSRINQALLLLKEKLETKETVHENFRTEKII